jgi:hypothetical protein
MQQAIVMPMEEYDHKQSAHISLKKIKTTNKVIKDKTISQSSYTILEGLLDERHGKHVKT